MLLNRHPGIRVAHRSIGAEGAPLLVIDQLVAEPERLVGRAARSRFVRQGSMFPGIRARAPLSYERLLESTLTPLLSRCFGLAPGRFQFSMCHYSLVTQAPDTLHFLQRVPHVDSLDVGGLATVHYLFQRPWGGTAFYRHRRTGFESIDAARREAYFDCLDHERTEGGEPDGYINADTALFERIASVDGVFNRLVVYRRNSLHSGSIDNAMAPPPDPLAGRLSINSFIDVVP